MAESTSSATAPAEAYSFCALVAKAVVILDRNAPLIARKGVKAIKRRVSLHSWEKAIAKPAKKVVIHWMKMANLSPIPA